VTRRADVPVLAFTVPEAARALRLGENELRLWVKAGIVKTVRWQSLVLVPRIELDRLINSALDNGGTLPAIAVPDAAPVSAGREAASGSGAASPHARTAVGEVGTAVGPSSASLPGRSTPSTQSTRLARRADATTAG